MLKEKITLAKNKVDIVGIDTSSLEVISSKKTIELLKDYRENNDKEIFDYIVMGNLKLVLSIVNKYSKRNENLDDLFQIGVLGLLKTINNFDTSQDVMFSTYAVPMIEGEIRRYLRDSSFLRVSRQLKDLAYHYMKEKEKYLFEHGSLPTDEEMEKILSISHFELVEAIESTLPLSSLNEPVFSDNDESIILEDVVTKDSDNHNKLVTHLSLLDGINSLKEIERDIIYKRYYEGKSQVEISSIYSISQAQVSRIEKQALLELRKYVI